MVGESLGSGGGGGREVEDKDEDAEAEAWVAPSVPPQPDDIRKAEGPPTPLSPWKLPRSVV